MSSPVRVQIISESTFVAALKDAKTPDLDLTDHKLPESDQKFGLAEAAAVIAISTSIAKLIEAVVKAYNATNNDNLEVTIKTVKGVITVKGKRARTVAALMEEFQDVT